MTKSSFDYKTKLNQSRKLFVKRIATLTVASTLVLTVTPTLYNNPLNNSLFGSSVAYAQSSNLMDSSEITSKFHINHGYDNEYTSHTLVNDGRTYLTAEQNNLVYTIKFPDELAYLLDDDQIVSRLVDEFVVTGFVLDSNNEQITLSSYYHPPENYVQINKNTNSVVFKFSDYLKSYGLKTVEDTSYGFWVEIETSYKGIANGDYTFKTALTEGPVNLDTLESAHLIIMSITYNDDSVVP
ncbi:hypothetical protein CHH83_11025, partial [Bacillus sp. 7586-K]